MKLSLSPEAERSLKAIQSEVRTFYPQSRKGLGAIASKVIQMASKEPERDFIANLAKQLLTPAEKRKERLRRLEEIASHLDDKTLARLEKKSKKTQETRQVDAPQLSSNSLKK